MKKDERRKTQMKTQLKIVALLLLLPALLVACATTQEAWNKLTPDQKARIILNGMQDELNNMWTMGKNAVAAKPDYAQFWKEKVVPAFDVANKAINTAAQLAATGQLKPEDVYGQIQPLLNSIATLLTQMGVVIKSQPQP